MQRLAADTQRLRARWLQKTWSVICRAQCLIIPAPIKAQGA